MNFRKNETGSDYFSFQAAEYAQFRPRYPAKLFDWLRSQVEVAELAWDCACGSGQATDELAMRFKQVVATDVSQKQLDHAPPIPNVEYRLVPAENSRLAVESVDLITVAQALHWFDLTKFWHEANRVLKPGGVLAAWSYGIFRIEDQTITDICMGYYAGVLKQYWPPERRIVEAGYGSLELPFAEIVPPQFEMTVDWSLRQLLGYFASWSATAKYRITNGRDPLKELEQRLRKVWPHDTRRIEWPLSVRVGRKGILH